MKRFLVAQLSVLVAMVLAAPVAAKPEIDVRISALEHKVEALAVHEKVLRARAARTGKPARLSVNSLTVLQLARVQLTVSSRCHLERPCLPFQRPVH